MAALPAGVQYDLSSEASYNGNRDLMFVKLTDSALRSIEEFIRNMGKIGSTPTIQFLPESKEGKISIPNVGGGAGSQPITFRFSLASNADLEGPQGSFECLQGSGVGKPLRNLGALPSRIRVLANDDVYEATKQRMTVDAENLKSKCTRELKPNQINQVGRKVSVKQQRPPPARPPLAPSGPAPPVAPPSRLGAAPPSSLQHHNYGSGNDRPVGVNGSSQPRPNNRPEQPASNAHRGTTNTTTATSDVAKQPIKERLIQLLALKSYKKPELYARISSEGIRDKERSVIKTILLQISSFKDNSYHLHRNLWNEVKEDWRFYSEEEKQILKRRKPQNLTPPLSSDSGHSPSPPPGKRGAAAPLPASSNGAVPPPNKKQRISHYRKPMQDTTMREGDSSPFALSNGYHSSTSTSGASSGERKNYSDEDTPPPSSLTPNRRDNGYSLSFGTVKNFLDTPPKQNGYQTSPPSEHIVNGGVRGSTPCSPLPVSNGRRSGGGAGGGGGGAPPSAPPPAPATTTDKSPDRQKPAPLQLPDEFLRQYPPITSQENRRRYKSEFNDQYRVYLLLHRRIFAVQQLFTDLEAQLNKESPDSPMFKEIKQRIMHQYQKYQSDEEYQRDVIKFNLLHLKLNHIKERVGVWDQLQGELPPAPPACY